MKITISLDPIKELTDEERTKFFSNLKANVDKMIDADVGCDWPDSITQIPFPLILKQDQSEATFIAGVVSNKEL